MIFQSYLSLLGIEEIEAPSLSFLTKLYQHHIETIAYTNLDFIFGREISLDIKDILYKLSNEHPGGVCYELSYAFYNLLKFLNFDIKLVYANLPKVGNLIFKHSEIAHVVGLVNLNNTIYLVDVGFGNWFRYPINIYQTEHEDITGKYHLMKYSVNNTNNFLLKKQKDNNYIDYYSFSLNHDFIPPKIMNYINFPEEVSPNLYGDFIYTLPTRDGCRHIINREYIKVSNNTKIKIMINTYEQFISILTEEMHVNKQFAHSLSQEKFKEILSIQPTEDLSID